MSLQTIKMLNSSSKSGVNAVFAFFFPIIGLIVSIVDYRKPYAKNLFWFFCAFYGLVHIYLPNASSGIGGADGERYAANFEYLAHQDISWETLSNTFYGGGQNNNDIFEPTVSFVVSRFTDNPHVLFCAFALIFGFFYSRNIWYILRFTPNKLGFVAGIFVVSLALLTPIWLINGVRMWTALQVFFCGFLPYLLNKDRSKLWWCYASFLFHFSFLILIALLLVFQFLPHKRLPYFIAFIVSLFISELDIGIVRERLMGLGLTAFEAKINTYTSQEYAEHVKDAAGGYSWHVIFAKDLMAYVFKALLIVAYFAFGKLRKLAVDESRRLNMLFCAAAFIYAFANVVSSIPSWGRFGLPAQVLSAVLSIVIVQYLNSKIFKKIYLIAAILLVYPIVFLIRTGMDYWGLSLLVTNPLTCWFVDDNLPLIALIKQL